jgi:hypothetical protein
VLGRGRPLFKLLDNVLPEFRGVLIAMNFRPVLHDSFKKLFLGVGGKGYGATNIFTRIIATINVISTHDQYLWRPLKIVFSPDHCVASDNFIPGISARPGGNPTRSLIFDENPNFARHPLELNY